MEKDLDHRQPCLAFAALASSLPEGWDGAGPRWIKLAPLGRVMGRDGRGPYDFGDGEAAAVVVASSKAYLAGIDGMIDYDHAYDLGALKGVGTAPAAGWIKDLKVEADGVYGLVEWTAKAAAAIAGKEYRYISPVFLHDTAGRVSKIIRAALTAHPNFAMPALASAQNPGEDMTVPKEVAAALGLAETADGAQAAAAVTKLKTELAAAQTGLAAAAQAVGLAAGAEPAAVCAAAGALKAKSDQPPDPAQYVPMAAFQEVTKALASAQAGGAQREAETLADKLSAEGKLAPAQRDWFLALAAADPAAAKAYAASAPVIVPPGQTAPPNLEPGKTAALTAEQKAACAAIGVAEADYIKVLGAVA